MNARLAIRLVTTVLLCHCVGALAFADVDAGLEAFRREDYATALREWTPAAEAGDSSAQFHLGLLYARGLGLDRDLARAVQLYRQAADAGLARAQYEVGSAHLTGRGAPRDEALAVDWYRKAAEQDFAKSQYSLAVAYELGVGIAQDRDEAEIWFRRAAEQGHEQAQRRLGLLLSENPRADDEETDEWLRVAAEKGEVAAHWRLGGNYARGTGGRARDYERAVPLLREAAKQYPGAAYELGLIYEKGPGFKDPLEARKWYKFAAREGIVAAQERLAFDPRLRSQHLLHAQVYDGLGEPPARVPGPEALRLGPPAAVRIPATEVYCDFFPRVNGGSHPKFRCFMMTGARATGGRYYDEDGNVRHDADGVLVLDAERGPTPVLAAENDAGRLEPLTGRDGFAPRFVLPFELKVKYRAPKNSDPVFEREMYTEVAAARLMWALGFPADRMYRVAQVHCHRCPQDPFTDLVPGAEDRYTTFEDVSIELRYGAGRIENYDEWAEGGWSWGEELHELRYGKAPHRFSSEQEMHFDALIILMNIIQRESKPPHQNRLVCRRGTIQQLGPYKFCPDTVLLVHDLGSTFGRRRPHSLQNWRQMPVWGDPKTCEVSLPGRSHDQYKLESYVVGEAGQEFILGLLGQLADEHLRALFEYSGFDRYDLTLASPGEPLSPAESKRIIDAWIAGFHEKVEQVRLATCEGS